VAGIDDARGVSDSFLPFSKSAADLILSLA
jgi:hypothetical protein